MVVPPFFMAFQLTLFTGVLLRKASILDAAMLISLFLVSFGAQAI